MSIYFHIFHLFLVMITLLSASKGAQNHRATRKRCRQLQTLSESGLVAAETGEAVGEEGHERILMMGTLLHETTSEMDFWCCSCSNCFHMYALTYDLLHVYKCRYIYIWYIIFVARGIWKSEVRTFSEHKLLHSLPWSVVFLLVEVVHRLIILVFWCLAPKQSMLIR